MVNAYRRIIKTTMFITSISMFALGAVSEPLLFCLIGPKWQEAATYLPLICITGSTYPLHAINLNMLQVQGRSDLFLGLEIIKKIIAIGPLLIGAFVGMVLGIVVAIYIEPIRQFFQWATGRDLFPSELYYLSELPSKLMASQVIGIVVLAIALAFLATLYPAWKAANTDPVEVLRNE